MADDSLTGKKIAVYARFSSELQNERSIEDQIDRCREWVEARGGAIPEQLVFFDRAMSGTSIARPGLERMMRTVETKPRPVDVIVVEDLSRLSRSSADLFAFQRLFEFNQVRLLGVGDGIDTAADHSTLTFGMKSIVSEIYVKDLRDKTVRGLRGRAKQGLSTGGLPLGYRSLRSNAGSAIEIDNEASALVIRIFELYRDGTSFAGIAARLNNEGVPSPRRKAGWIAATIRAILRNQAYVGRWRYGARRWRKAPGTNKRRPTENAPETIITMDRADLRIVHHDLWLAVQDRLAAIRRCYAPHDDGSGPRLSGRKTPYLLTGLLVCGVCGGRMQISGGSAAMYYRCSNAVKRGTCANRLSVREDKARASIFAELRHRLSSTEGIAHARKRIAERLGELARERTASRRDRGKRVEELEKQIGTLVDLLAQGRASAAILERLERLETQLADAKATLRVAEDAKPTAIELPSPDALHQLVFDLEARLMEDVAKGRELLRRLFRDGAITLIPKDGFYAAKSEVLPLMLLTAAPNTTTPPKAEANGGVQFPLVSCAGRI